ncbi:MAG TPA: hypothetical protein VHE13_15170 [Opitutus sp.]|nr:hypothetical protein [Opitutus sp.]
MNLCPSVCIIISGVVSAVSPKSQRGSPCVSEGHDAGSTATIPYFFPDRTGPFALHPGRPRKVSRNT